MTATVACFWKINVRTVAPPSSLYTIEISSKLFAAPTHDGIQIGNYLNDRIFHFTLGEMNSASLNDDKRIEKVVAISSNHEIWAYATADFTVKIVDKDKKLLRDIQFNEQIISLCFANRRGDLLIGLSDQISLVRIQDYLPAIMLQDYLSKSFEDDNNEAPIDFDSGLEFWAKQYEEHMKQVKNGDNIDWHLKNVKHYAGEVVEKDFDSFFKMMEKYD